MATLSKTMAPLLILQYLKEHSDEHHPVIREQIEAHLEVYGITLERKAFFRHMENLKEMLEETDDIQLMRRDTVRPADPNRKPCAGFYVTDRTFSDGDLRVIIDSLSGSRFLSEWETEDFVSRLASLSSRHFQKRMSAYQFVGGGNKTVNKTLLLNLETIDDAIAQHKQICFDWLVTNKQGEKEIYHSEHLVNKEHCTPVRYFVKDQTYYLVGVIRFDEKSHLTSYDLSTMTNVEILDKPAVDFHTVPGFKKGVDWTKFLREHPTLDNLRGKPELCTFHCKRYALDEIQGHFGDELRVSPAQHSRTKRGKDGAEETAYEDLLEVSVITDPYAAMRFTLQHLDHIWLISPYRANQSLRWRLEKQMRYYDQLEEKIGAGVPEKVFKNRQEKDLNFSLADGKKKK